MTEDQQIDKVHAAVQQALADGIDPATGAIALKACACGETPMIVMIEMAQQGSKVATAVCGACTHWGIEFLVPRGGDQKRITEAAAKAWNNAPRAVTE